MRVLQLISSAGNYGAENVVLNLSRALKEAGTPSTLAVFHNIHRPNLDLAEAARRDGNEVVVLPCVGRIDRNAVQALRDLINRRELDLVHSHGYKAHAYAYCAIKSGNALKRRDPNKKSCALVGTCHGHHSAQQSMGAELRQKMYAGAEMLMLRRFDRVVAVSDSLAESLRNARISRQRLSVIGNGIDLSRFERASAAPDLMNAKGGRLAIGLVGRLVAGKGHDIALQAIHRLVGRLPGIVLMIVGDGPSRKLLQSKVQELRLSEHVLFTGKRNDMPSVYAALDACILPSLNEGMPMVILEAMAAKKAVIASNVGAIPDLILQQQTGLLIPPADVHALEQSLEVLLRDAGLRQMFGAAGSRLVHSKFAAKDMAGKYLNLYRETLCRAAMSATAPQ